MKTPYKDSKENIKTQSGQFRELNESHAWRMGLAQKGWLRPTVLKVLGQSPMNGIGIINGIREMSHGWYKPSPGSIYPLLETLENDGMIKKRTDGKYELTSKYKTEFGSSGEVDEILTGIESNISYLEELLQGDNKKLSSYKKRVEKIQTRVSKLSK